MFVVLAAASASHAQGNGTFSAICNTGKWNCTGLGNVSNQPQGRTLEVSFFTANMSADGIGKVNLWEYTLTPEGAILTINVVTLDADVEVGALDPVTNSYPVYATFATGSITGAITPHRVCTYGRGAHCGTSYIFGGSAQFN